MVGNIVKSRMKWTGHVIRMKDERLPKRSETTKQGGCRKRGRPHPIWEECVEIDLIKKRIRGRKRKGQHGRMQQLQRNKVDVPCYEV